MTNNDMKDQFSRRKFLGVSSAALAAGAGSLLTASATAQENSKTRTDRSATDPGPANKPLDGQNSDSAWPPSIGRVKAANLHRRLLVFHS